MPPIVIDVHEKNDALNAIADGRRHLQCRNEADPAHPHSYDIEVTTRAGQVFTFERKAMLDAIGTFLDKGEKGRLVRQARAAGALIVEWDAQDFEMRFPEGHPRRLGGLNAKKRLWHMQICGLPVIVTDSVAETISFLRWLEAKAKPLADLGPGEDADA